MTNLYLLGHPVAHSKSPAMHNAVYRALGLDWEYGLMDCPTPQDAQAFMESRAWIALNVTTPYKPLAFEVAMQNGQSSPEARLAQGANVVIAQGSKLYADNTDGKGCVSYLQRCGFAFEGSAVALCGTGPTARALIHAIAQAGAAHVTLLGRDGDKCQQVLGEYRANVSTAQDAKFTACSYRSGYEYLSEADLVIDATPLGMNADDLAPFDTALLKRGQWVLDVVYGQGVTATIAGARKAGCTVHDGTGMLVAQAVETVRDIAKVTGAFAIPESLDLFAVMAQAAEFDL